ncbi:secretion-regulating guanine nucleotide exchange factor [Anaeramoeba flamelloides]|uniref:Secretion-regulating guanine nucleotide exchange factor n=1 Tax=Anaeramoeba flamelloides TaxID=1746091 RepID=A0ABQ8ZC11_9EUKA|nr:secretion-regulating guanine nucleotide exchange factor [Anaeramoeba flamelloides]
MSYSIFVSGNKMKWVTLLPTPREKTDVKQTQLTHFYLTKKPSKIVLSQNSGDYLKLEGKDHFVVLYEDNELEYFESAYCVNKCRLSDNKILDIASGEYFYLVLTAKGLVYYLSAFGMLKYARRHLCNIWSLGYNHLKKIDLNLDSQIKTIKVGRSTSYFLLENSKLYGYGGNAFGIN